MKRLLLTTVLAALSINNVFALYEYKISSDNKYHTEPLVVEVDHTSETQLGKVSAAILSPIGIVVGSLVAGLASGLSQGVHEGIEKTF